MDAVSEVFPMIAGVLTGLICAYRMNPRIKYVLWAIMTIAFGVIATFISGEYRESWLFVLLDMLWVGAVSYGIILALVVYRRRQSHG